MSEYVDQLKAFFHYTLQHAFSFEFGVRILVEVPVLMFIVSFIFKLITKVTSKIFKVFSVVIDFIAYDIFLPIGKTITDYFAYKIGSLKWQKRADKIKQMILKHDEKQAGQIEQQIEHTKKQMKQTEKKKSFAGYSVLVFIILIGYLESFHYLFPNVKESYPVFFLPESLILNSENFWENVVFETDEKAIPCFYDLVHQNETDD